MGVGGGGWQTMSESGSKVVGGAWAAGGGDEQCQEAVRFVPGSSQRNSGAVGMVQRWWNR